jgi:hypothetical protein
VGCTAYRWGGDVEAKVRALQPHFVVIGDGAWNDLSGEHGIIAACPNDATFILRNMADNLIDWNVADVVNGMLQVAHRYPDIPFVAHALNEAYQSEPAKAGQWEISFIDRCHDYGLRTICLNGAYGNDPFTILKVVAQRSDFIGWHAYDGWLETIEVPRFVDRIYTSRRYASNWLWDYREKMIATEVGVEAYPATGHRRGWHDMGLSEQVVADRMVENAHQWKRDGLLGACWFTAGHTEQSWDEGYGLTEGMARHIAQHAPLPPEQKEDKLAGLTEAEYAQALPKIDSIYGDLNDFDGFESSNDILIPAKVGMLEQQKRTVQNMRKTLLELKEIVRPK